MQTWKNITVYLQDWDLKKATEQLSGLDVLSITIVDKLPQEDSQWFEETGRTTPVQSSSHSLILLADMSKDTEDLLSEVKFMLKLEKIPQYSEEIFEDRDWVTYTRSQFREIMISENLRITPPWDAQRKFEGITIIIDPGAGFGTGTHPTTQLCLRWLERNLRIGNSLLDYGCGSGILAIAGAFFGAKRITGIDLDDQALNNARHNIELNRTDIELLPSENFNIERRYDIVVANILANVLVDIEPVLQSAAARRLVLSGILPDQAIRVREAFATWVRFDQIDKQDGWLLLSGTI